MSRPTVPPPSDEDHEDVAWALRAASAQWRREDHADAISWVRRAAETAVEVGQALRARDLFQLANYLEGGPLPDSMKPPAGMAPPRVVPGHPVAIAPPPPSFGEPDVADDDLDLSYDDIDDDEEVEVEEVEDDDEVVIDDELEDLPEPPSFAPPSFAPPSFAPPSFAPGSSAPPSAGRPRPEEPSTRYSSAPPSPRPTGAASQFPSQVPTRASAKSSATGQGRWGGRPGSTALSSRPAFPGSLPPLPSLGPAGGLTSRPPSSGPLAGQQGAFRDDPWRPDLGTDSEPIVPATPSSSTPPLRSSSTSRRLSGGFDEAFLDSLEEDELPPMRRGPRPKVPFNAGFDAEDAASFDAELEPAAAHSRRGDYDFGGPSSSARAQLPSVPDLPSLGVAPAPSHLPMDPSTAAEYAQHSRRGPYEQHRTIEEELGVNLSLNAPPAGRDRAGAQRLEHSPTPGRVSSRPKRPTAIGLGEPPLTSGEQPFPLAPSASVPPVAPIEPPSHPSYAPPPESMSEPDAESADSDRKSYELTGQVLGDRVSLAAGSPTPLPSVEDDDDDILAGAFERLQSVHPRRPASEGPAEPRRPGSHRPQNESGAEGTVVDGTDLLDVPGLQDLPEDAATLLASRAQIVQLAHGEEVSAFGVALVTAGSVQLMPTIADASCVHLRKGEVLFTKGTMVSDISLRVVGAEPGSRVAVFSERDLEIATSSCPWVADELAEVADRYNAFGGAVLGPLGESLDEMFRMMVFEKCSMKNPPAGTLIAEAGKPMDGMYVLGAGTLDVVSPSGSVTDRLGPGDFVFPETVLSAGPASATVRVPQSGALLLYADRRRAHELLATCPPFIEILAG